MKNKNVEQLSKENPDDNYDTNNYINSNTLNQNFNIQDIPPSNNIHPVDRSEIPIQKNINVYLSSNNYTYNDLNPNIKDILNNPKYRDDKRSQSAFSQRNFREKFESVKLKVPENKKWNFDPAAEIMIHNMEQKIDILLY